MLTKQILACFVLSNTASAATVIEDTYVRLERPEDRIGIPEGELVFSAGPDLFSELRFKVEENETGVATLTVVETSFGDAGADWLRADFGDLFNSAWVEENRVEAWWNVSRFGNPPSIDVPINEDLWFGIDSGVSLDVRNGEHFVYGWAQFRVEQNLDVTLINSAYTLDGGQIIVGRNVVPEPAVNALLLFGALALLRRRL